jgi:hypothetical protein
MDAILGVSGTVAQKARISASGACKRRYATQGLLERYRLPGVRAGDDDNVRPRVTGLARRFHARDRLTERHHALVPHVAA